MMKTPGLSCGVDAPGNCSGVIEGPGLAHHRTGKRPAVETASGPSVHVPSMGTWTKPVYTLQTDKLVEPRNKYEYSPSIYVEELMTANDPETLAFYADEAVRYANQSQARSFDHLDTYLQLLPQTQPSLSLAAVAGMTPHIC
ncbi:hypothetical protein [Phyllobacterium sp. 628]|uniref:hypothetical protein n=1 Tax=Phyllobacterium sp. 628 TaxID=2718938 RepID=UPI00352FF7C2